MNFTNSTVQQLPSSGRTEEEMYFLALLTSGQTWVPLPSPGWGPQGVVCRDLTLGAASTPHEPSSPILGLRIP